MNSLSTISAKLVREIEGKLNSIGIMYRIFSRVKSPASLTKKIESNPGKYGEGKKVQDVIGIRVAVYFLDDVEVVGDIVSGLYRIDNDNSMIDSPKSDTFKASRFNVVCNINNGVKVSEFFGSEYSSFVDETFEVQIRTILSEGWHEVDHDLRYKCGVDWAGMGEEDRALNGLLATLETTDWSLLQIFDQLSYKHFKGCNFEAMIRNKFRVRFASNGMSESLKTIFYKEPLALKKLFRTDRKRVFEEMMLRSSLPLEMDNLIFICNKISINNDGISKLSPRFFDIWWDNVDE